MPFAGYLGNTEINDLVTAASTSGLITVPRAVLLAGIPPGFVAGLPLMSSLLDQFTVDLVGVNQVERMAGGEVPLVILLQNVVARLKLLGREEATRFEQTLNRVGSRTAGVPDLPTPASLPEVEKQERIIGLDDTLDLTFFAGGMRVAGAVARILVPRFENASAVTVAGGPWVLRGTAWLLTPQLAITNHHVVNARLAGEPDAAAPDLALQAANATLHFDVDAKDAAGVPVTVRRLVAATKDLDYAVLELTEPMDRPLPLIAEDPVVIDATSRIAVNIVQHPRGEYKQVAFRNNLVSAADDTTVRYFTDTDHGSSGSPVCDDRWQVVALHRGARHTGGVQFQGARRRT